jgi:DNA-directed RNA polymerase specialized sigma24 family protein
MTEQENRQARIAALMAGDASLAEPFLTEIASAVWASCSLLATDDAREAFREIMTGLCAGNFASFRTYDGRSSLRSFVALRARDLLAGRVLKLLHADPQRGWRAFEALFRSDFLRLIGRRLQGAVHEDTRAEAYQAITLALVDSDCRRLKAYGGKGSFTGFVLTSADRLLIDFVRGLNVQRRLTDAVAKLATVDGEALEPSPEVHYLQSQEDAQLAAALAVLTRAIETLGEAERLYIAIVLGSAQAPPSREIARLMRRPVQDVYKLKQRVLKHLRDLVAEDSTVKNWRASV